MHSRENGSRKLSAAALRVLPASNLSSSAHNKSPGSVWRGKTAQKKTGKVLPQPLRCPRSEQNTLWPLTNRPAGADESLPRRTLWRLSDSVPPQCGQGCCLSEKARHSTLPGRARSENKAGSYPFPLPDDRLLRDPF